MFLFQKPQKTYRKRGPKRKSRKDPTQTGGVLRKWNADLRRRFEGLKQAIREAIVDKDVFGMREGFFILEAGRIYLKPREFHFTTDAEKLNGFMGWVDEMVDRNILGVIERDGVRVVQHEGWQNKYLYDCYNKGVQGTRRELEAVGLKLPDSGLGFDLRGPVHAPKVGTLYSRAFDELKGITSAQSQQIGRVLAEGFAQGKGPMEIAQMINDRVDKIGLTRSRLLARTETAYARNKGTMAEAEWQEQVIGEEILFQWETAGDDRVRPEHEARRGRVFTKEEVEELLGEPNCRCNIVRYIKSIQGELDERTRLPLDKREWPRDLIEDVEVVTEQQAYLEELRPSIQEYPNISSSFRSIVTEELDSLPYHVTEYMKDRGVEIHLGEYFTQMRPELKGKTPRGWPSYLTWDDCEGGFNRLTGKIYLAEKTRRFGKVSPKRVKGVLKHEVGHTFGELLLNQEALIKAHSRDIDILRTTHSDLSYFRYYLQAGDAGRSETFAEVFAALHGGGSRDPVRILAAFPNVAAFVQGVLW